MIQPAVARITSSGDGAMLGTAFAVDDHVALTAFHCVREGDASSQDPMDEVELSFLAGETTPAEVVDSRPAEDWAILRLEAPLSAASRPIPLRAEVQPGDACRCLGFPYAAEEIGYLGILATVSATDTRYGGGGSPVLALEAETVAAGFRAHGMSGGPVVLRGTYEPAVGLVRSHLGEPGDRETPMGGVLFACPTRLFSDAPSLARPAVPTGDLSGSLTEDLTAAAEAGDVSAATRLGHLLHATGDGSAERWLRQAARGGDPASAYALGILIDPAGTLIDQDPALAEEALVWFRRAATGGDVYGATTMGIRLRQRGRDDAALPWLEEAVERGADAMAAHTLGRIYEDRGDHQQAERWERFAAKRGDIRAAYDLGRMLNDRGSRDEAILWLRRATVDDDAVRLLRELGAGP